MLKMQLIPEMEGPKMKVSGPGTTLRAWMSVAATEREMSMVEQRGAKGAHSPLGGTPARPPLAVVAQLCTMMAAMEKAPKTGVETSRAMLELVEASKGTAMRSELAE